MKKMLVVASSIAAMSLFGVASASAADFATAPGTYRAQGNLGLYQSIPGVSCFVSMDIVVTAAGVATANNVTFSPGHPLCGSVIRPLTTSWPIHKVSKGVDEGGISMDVSVQAGGGTCTGNLAPLRLYWGTKGPNRIESDPIAFVAGTPSPCQVTGTLDVTPTGGTVGEFRMQ
ncbi:hypothetical protein D3C72_957810 [compost metagenome]|jgi:hypothetical protein